MKKIAIFMILLLVFVPVVFADPVSDYFRGIFGITGKVTSEKPIILHRTVRYCSDGAAVGPEQVIDLRTFRGGTYTNYKCKSMYDSQCKTGVTYYDEKCDYETTAETAVPVILKEQVKCIFANSNVKQECYTDDGKFRCSGVETCVADVSGESNKKLTWKSSCGEYSYTIIDGSNKYAEFKCETAVPEETTSAGNLNVECTESNDGYYVKGKVAYTKDGNYFEAEDKCLIIEDCVFGEAGCSQGKKTIEVTKCEGIDCYIGEAYCSDIYNIGLDTSFKCPDACNNGACVGEVEIPFEERDLIDLGSPIASKGQDAFSDGLGHLTIDQKSPTIETSLTSAEDDYQTNVVMEVDRDSLRYTLINPGNLIRASTKPIYLTLLGKEMKVTGVGVETDTSLFVDDKLVRDGDAFVGEDLDDPNWVWNLDNLMSDNPTVGIESDFIYNDESDGPPKVGQCIELPFKYTKICLDSLNVRDDEYDTYIIELDSGFKLNNLYAPSVHIYTKGEKVVSKLDSKHIWITGEGSVYYKDNSDAVKYWKKISEGKIGTMAPNLDLTSDISDNNIYINVNSMGQKTSLTTKFKLGPSVDKSSTGVISLGEITSFEEPSELTYGGYGRNTLNIGTKDEDHRTSYGIIIRDPKAHGASDEVVLEIPKKQVKAKVSIKFNKESIPTPSNSITLVNVGENAIIVDIGGVKKTIYLGSVVSIDQETSIGVLGVNKEKRSAVLLIGKPNTYYTMESIEGEPATVEEGTEACSTWDNMLGRC